MDGAEHLNDTARRSGVAVGAATAVLVLLVSASWSAVIGRYGGPDEPAHVLRSFAVAHGDLLGEPVDELPPGYRAVEVPASLGTGDPACYRFDPTVTSTCAEARPGGDVRVATSAGTYPPVYYAMVGLPARVFGVSDDPFALRLVAAAWIAVGCALVAHRVRSPARALLVAVVPPSCWFLWGVVNPNALEVVLIALAAASVRPRHERRRADDWWVAAPLVLCVAMRPVSVIWATGLLLMAELDPRTRADARGRLVRWAAPAVGAATVLVWNAWSEFHLDDRRTASDDGVVEAAIGSIGGLPRTGAELVASLGWLEHWAPWVAIVAWVAAIVAVLADVTIGARRRPGRDDRLVRAPRWAPWAVVAVMAIVVPVAFETILASRIGPVWQGRYSLPVLAIAAVWALAHVDAPIRRRTVRAVWLLAAVVSVSTFWWSARRYSVGTDGSWWFDGAEPTSRVFGPGTWVVVHVALVATAVGLRWVSSSARAASPASARAASTGRHPPRRRHHGSTGRGTGPRRTR